MIRDGKAETHSTHIEDLKDPVQLQPPTRNLSLPIARSKVFDQFVLLGKLFDLLLHFLNTSVIKSAVGARSQSIHHRIDSLLQPVYRIAYRLAELVCRLPARSPPKRITDVGAQYPEVHAILLIGHLVLTVFEPGRSRSRRGTKLTLIVVRRIVTTPKTVGAGVMLEASFPMFTRLMATSSERIAASRLVCCLDLPVMVER